MNSSKKFTNIDEYIDLFPKDVQVKLKKLRKEIHSAAPKANEAIKYGIPTFQLAGNLVHFAAYKNHIGFYPAPSGLTAFKKDLKNYVTSKGAVQFPIDEPIPFGLVKKIVKYRVKENLEKESLKKKK